LRISERRPSRLAPLQIGCFFHEFPDAWRYNAWLSITFSRRDLEQHLPGNSEHRRTFPTVRPLVSGTDPRRCSLGVLYFTLAIAGVVADPSAWVIRVSGATFKAPVNRFVPFSRSRFVVQDLETAVLRAR